MLAGYLATFNFDRAEHPIEYECVDYGGYHGVPTVTDGVVAGNGPLVVLSIYLSCLVQAGSIENTQATSEIY